MVQQNYCQYSEQLLPLYLLLYMWVEGVVYSVDRIKICSSSSKSGAAKLGRLSSWIVLLFANEC